MRALIPKVVHVTWPDPDIIHNQSPVVLNGLKNIQDLNPDWRIEISIDSEVDRYLQRNISMRDFELIRHRPFVERSDLWRLLKIYNEGGLYIDIDRYYNRPMTDIIDEHVHTVLPTNGDWDFSQDIMLSVPGHEIFSRAAFWNQELRRQGVRRVYHLGAQSYMHAVTSWILDNGQFINTNPGAVEFDRIRKALQQHPGISTYRESLPLHSVCFQYNAATWRTGNGRDKNQLYQEYGITHWMSLPE